MADFTWWTPLPWLIAFGSLLVSLVAYRRARYGKLSMRISCSGYFQSYGEADYHARLHVDLVAQGAEVYDIRVQLECLEFMFVRKYRTRWLPRLPMRVRHDFAFTPTIGNFSAEPSTAHPNPLKNGQAVQYTMTDHHLQSIALAYPYFRLPSQYWPGCVRIAVYQSGRRLVIKRKAWWFRRALSSFDIGSLRAAEAQRERPQAPSARGIEDQGMLPDGMTFLHPELNMPPPSLQQHPLKTGGAKDA